MKTRITIVLNERTLMLAKLKAVLDNETLSRYIGTTLRATGGSVRSSSMSGGG